MNIENLRIADLTPDPQNARQHDDKNLKAIMESLKQFGQRKPIVITEAGTIVAGNGTVEAAKRLGWLDIEVVKVPNDWTDAQVKAFAIADNRTAELANWNQQILTDQLRELELLGFDVVELGFELPEIQVEEESLDEEIPELPDNPVTVPGDLWKLGEHYLLCGDSTKTSDYEILMQGELADIVVTDPPWNVNYGAVKKGNPMGYKQRTIMNDHMGVDDWASFVDGFTSNFKAFSKPGAPLYCVMSAQEWPVIDDSLRRAGFHWSSTIIWAKDSLVLSRKDYHTQYEPIWYGWNSSGPRLVELKDRKQSDLWQVARPKRSELHPTTKPVELIARALQNSSKRGDLLLEPFGGSGSHLIAAEQTNRRCRAMELDPKYCDVIIERWERLTGQKAELLPAKAD